MAIQTIFVKSGADPIYLILTFLILLPSDRTQAYTGFAPPQIIQMIIA